MRRSCARSWTRRGWSRRRWTDWQVGFSHGTDGGTAADALRESRFVDLETTLADAERSTVDADVRRAVRAVRGEAALVRGHATQAAAHFVAAADYMNREEGGPESSNETMVFRSRAVARLVRHADTFGGDGAWIGDATKLCYANIKILNTDLWNKGARQMDLGNARLSAGRLKTGKEALDLFAAAKEAFRIASQRFGRDSFPVDWATARNGMGLAMAHSCFWYEAMTGEPGFPGRWTFAADRYAAAMEVQREAGETLQWAETRINWATCCSAADVWSEDGPGRSSWTEPWVCVGARSGLSTRTPRTCGSTRSLFWRRPCWSWPRLIGLKPRNTCRLPQLSCGLRRTSSLLICRSW